MLKDPDKGLQRIQKSVGLSAGNNLDDLKSLVKITARVTVFRVVEER